MINHNLKESLKNIINNMFGITLGFGWIIILISVYEMDNCIIPIAIYIAVCLIVSLFMELNDLLKKFNSNNIKNENKITSKLNELKIEKDKLFNSYNQKLNELESEKANLRKLYELEKEQLNINLSEEKIKLKKLYDNEKKKLTIKYNELTKKLNEDKENINKILSDEKIYKPYLAEILSNYNEEMELLKANILATKKNPAIKASKELREISKKNTALKKELKIKEHQLIVYENLFPWLEEFKEIPEAEINKIINYEMLEGYDRVKEFLSPEEYEKLADIKKYQLWLDRYKAKTNKSNWEIGIEFERYVGYKYEMDGYKLIYNGAREGLEDLGRDLIATKGKEILIIQCKNWSKSKIIHEKHIFQLYGTMILKSLEEPNKNINGIFICTTKLSETAKAVAKCLNIQVLENYKYDKNYPCIKCNVSKKDGSKIYHLPFDQQYDKVDIELKRGECYVHTIEEAEQLGFRKAMKHNFYE